MSKELPFFKFYSSEWMNGNITLEDYEVQGVFINICAYYWHRKCDVKVDELQRRFKPCLSQVEALFKGGLIEASADGKARLKFLDEQILELTNRKSELSEAGKKGVEAKKLLREASARLKQPLSNKEVDIDKEKKKNKKVFVPPSIFEVIDYFKENGYKTEIAEKAFKGYNEADWVDSKGNKVLNWKQKMINVWFKDEHKIPALQPKTMKM